MTDKSLYQLKISLMQIDPPIWRRIQVPRDITLDALHRALQIVMGWDDCHLHAFRFGKETYSDYQDEFDDLGMSVETGVPLHRVTGLRKRFVYEYDFGDGWEHLIAVEKELPIDPDAIYPHCVDGARACPPEDCGGVPGYYKVIEVLADPSAEDHAQLKEWLGDEFDPEAFDLAAVNRHLYASTLDDEDYDDETDAIVELTPEQLAPLSEEQLLDHLIECEDRAPRSIIDECVSRGSAMVEEIATYAGDDSFWDMEAHQDLGFWWLRLHAPFILGLIGGERAADLLIVWLYQLDHADDEDMHDWLAGYWPALFQRAPESVLPRLLTACRDRNLSWFSRAQAIDAYLAYRANAGAAALESALDEIAAILADESDSGDARSMLAICLLEFPRERHRALLDHLATLADPLIFDDQEIAAAFDQGEDDPSWPRFQNPWRFYEPEEIEKRQRRWAEARSNLDDPDFNDFDRFEHDDDPHTVVRATPKIGRNDPCPCGSGKKYKKCCLGT